MDAPSVSNEPVFRVTQGAVTLVGFVTARPRLIAATPGSVTVWDLARGQVISERPFSGSPLSRALTPDGRVLASTLVRTASGAQTYETGLLEIESDRMTVLRPPANDYSGVLAISADGTKLIRAKSAVSSSSISRRINW